MPLPAATAKRAPKVSILLITYNHEKYIAQALESVLMQETQFDYEINVIEDCSTDRTQEVVMRYVEKYPDKVKPFFNEKNIGFKVTQRNFVRGFRTLTGDYIAILEGDDYWTSPQKLQKQVSFLEANSRFVACAHNTVKVYEDGSQEPHRFLYWPGRPEEHTVEDFIQLRSYFHATSLMFRNVFKGVPPRQFENKWSCEIFVTIAHAQYGSIRHFDEDMSVYRAHGGGRFSTMSVMDGWLFNINGLRRYNQWLGYRYLRTFSESIVRYCNVALNEAEKYGAKPLPFHRSLKYLGVKCCYQILYNMADTVEQMRALRRTKPSYVHVALAVVGYIVLLCIVCALRLLNGLLVLLYRAAAAVMPEAVKQRVERLNTAHGSICRMHELVRQGELFTRHGIADCAHIARAGVRRLWKKAA